MKLFAISIATCALFLDQGIQLLVRQHRHKRWRRVTGDIEALVFCAMDEHVYPVATVSYSIGDTPLSTGKIRIPGVDFGMMREGDSVGILVHPTKATRFVLE